MTSGKNIEIFMLEKLRKQRESFKLNHPEKIKLNEINPNNKKNLKNDLIVNKEIILKINDEVNLNKSSSIKDIKESRKKCSLITNSSINNKSPKLILQIDDKLISKSNSIDNFHNKSNKIFKKLMNRHFERKVNIFTKTVKNLIKKKISENIVKIDREQSFSSKQDNSINKEEIINKLDLIINENEIGNFNSTEYSPLQTNSQNLNSLNLIENLLKLDLSNKKPFKRKFKNQCNDFNSVNVEKDAKFIKRMQNDVDRRQSKLKRLELIWEKFKPKLDEKIRREAFNRLIKDANRRIESKNNIKALEVFEERILFSPKKYNMKEWLEIYNKR